MPFADPCRTFSGVTVIATPHMDDEILACGGTIASLPAKERVHCIYATDGSKSPIPTYRWQGSVPPDLPSIRMREAKAALNVLGVSEDNLHFLQFPDGKLGYYVRELAQALAQLLQKLKASCVLVPFRYDRHPDHLAVNRAVMRALQGDASVELFEYFVYYRWSLLPGKDVRKFIRPGQLIEIDIRDQAVQKKKALECFSSQTTLFFPWQDRPIVPRERLVEVSQSPECFLKYNPEFSGSGIFASARTWIPLVHLVEPFLKNRKEEIRALLRLVRFRYDQKARE